MNGNTVAVIPADTSYSDILPDYGNYTYCVYAVYNEGSAVSSCSYVNWANPMLTWSPAELIHLIWSANSEIIPLTLGNTGLGTLAFEFPDYTDHWSDSPLAYCPASATNADEFISRVQLNTLDNTSAWSGYSNYSGISTILTRGDSYPFTVTVGPPSYSGDICGVWIDYDHSSTFDANEFTPLSGTQFPGTILVPLSAAIGPTTMRVRLQYNGTLSPCGTTTYGEVEDYTVDIKEDNFVKMVYVKFLLFSKKKKFLFFFFCFLFFFFIFF